MRSRTRRTQCGRSGGPTAVRSSRLICPSPAGPPGSDPNKRERKGRSREACPGEARDRNNSWQCAAPNPGKEEKLARSGAGVAANERGPVRARRAWGPAHVAVSTQLLVARSAHMHPSVRAPTEDVIRARALPIRARQKACTRRIDRLRPEIFCARVALLLSYVPVEYRWVLGAAVCGRTWLVHEEMEGEQLSEGARGRSIRCVLEMQSARGSTRSTSLSAGLTLLWSAPVREPSRLCLCPSRAAWHLGGATTAVDGPSVDGSHWTSRTTMHVDCGRDSVAYPTRASSAPGAEVRLRCLKRYLRMSGRSSPAFAPHEPLYGLHGVKIDQRLARW